MEREEFLDIFFQKLNSLEQELTKVREEKFSNVFVLGLPRSGTTFLTQVIHRNTNVECTNNLVARFWRTPLVGAYLSRLTLTKTTSENYQSDYGRTLELSDPHEFSWFWHYLLNIQNPYDHSPHQNLKHINRDKVFLKLVNLNRIFDAPLVHKPMEFVGMYTELFSAILKKSIFVFIDRNSLNIAHSIFVARSRNCNSMMDWWGSVPDQKTYQQLKELSPEYQIAGQLKYFHELYRKSLNSINQSQVLITSYEKLCSSPEIVLAELREKSDRLDGGIEVAESLQKGCIARSTELKKKDICDTLKLALEATEVDSYCFN